MAYARGIDPHRPRMRMLLAGSSIIVLGLALACAGEPGVPMNSSSGDPPEVPPWSCVPGETQPCPCDEDLEGLMTCDAQGAGFGECDCSPGAVSQGPPPTSTGSDTGSGTAGSGDSTAGSTGGSSGEPDPTTSGSSSGEPDPTTSGGSSSGSSSSSTAG